MGFLRVGGQEMTDREKLIELIATATFSPVYGVVSTIGSRFTQLFIEKIADHLLAHGVTVKKWIPVTERLPEGADGKSICENVIAYLNNGEVKEQVCPGWLNGDKWYLLVGDEDCHTVWGLGAVTHWMPLPEPPKED